MPKQELLASLRQKGLVQLYPAIPRITVGMGTCGRAAGALQVFQALQRTVGDRSVKAEIIPVGCEGMCWAEPLVEIQLPGQPRAVYGNVEIAQIEGLVDGLITGTLPEEGRLGLVYRDWYPLLNCEHILALGSAEDWREQPYIKIQHRQVMSNCGRIRPDSVLEYVATGGYAMLEKALEIGPAQVLKTIEASGLRGRGGAGFPTATKWRLTREGMPGPRYVIVNADEGDPGAYMDRGMLESDPHRVLEGLAIAAYTVGAEQAYIFIRSEYRLAIEILKRALEEAEAYGLLGNNIMGSGFSLHVGLTRSAGAFVCGEESALLKALENDFPEPKTRPPFPSESGLWGLPTSINNVETLANVPVVLALGVDKYRQLGTQTSPGTKIFSLAGGIDRPGLIEIPFGTSIDTIVQTIGGCSKEQLKAIQIGGPSGAILPVSLKEQQVDYESLKEIGAMVGSGGLVVLTENQCVVDTVKYFLDFSVKESCGKCTPCREGLADCAAILDRITAGHATAGDLAELERKGNYVASNSMCGLGRMAAGPILSSLRYFRGEYEQHLEGRCPALVCKGLIHFEIIPSKCQGERCCLVTCPGSAIKGSFGKPGRIVERLCTKCWMCTVSCPYGAVRVYT